ncbi:MAG: hypothetical protein ACK5LK_01695 [Chthoniobacterales bacterium]
MNTAPQSNNNQPIKDENVTAKPTSKLKPNREGGITTKTQIINSAWSAEIAAEFGITGSLSKAVALQLTEQISNEVSRKYSRSKIAKIVQAALRATIK